LHPSVPAKLKDISLLFPLIIALTKSRRSDSIKRSKFRLTPSFESGLYGGLIGGSLSGLLIGLPYFVENRNWVPKNKMHIADRVTWSIVPESVLYSALIGLAVGASTQYLIGWFRHLAGEDQLRSIVFNDLSGGVLGGILAGLFVGAEGGWIFGAKHIPPVSDPVLICGSAVGPIFIVLGSLVYDYRRRWRNVARALLCSAVVAYLANCVGIYILQRYGIGGSWFNGADVQRAIEEGAVLGDGCRYHARHAGWVSHSLLPHLRGAVWRPALFQFLSEESLSHLAAVAMPILSQRVVEGDSLPTSKISPGRTLIAEISRTASRA
jgi:hypothetical protein